MGVKFYLEQMGLSMKSRRPYENTLANNLKYLGDTPIFWQVSFAGPGTESQKSISPKKYFFLLSNSMSICVFKNQENLISRLKIGDVNESIF